MKVPCPAIIKEHNFHMNGVEIHDQLKTSYEINHKSRFQYYLQVFFDLIDSVVVNAHVIYKNKVNSKMSLVNFKIILAKLLINQFYSWKRKITVEEPQLTVKLPQSLKEPDQITLSNLLKNVNVASTVSLMGKRM